MARVKLDLTKVDFKPDVTELAWTIHRSHCDPGTNLCEACTKSATRVQDYVSTGCAPYLRSLVLHEVNKAVQVTESENEKVLKTVADYFTTKPRGEVEWDLLLRSRREKGLVQGTKDDIGGLVTSYTKLLEESTDKQDVLDVLWVWAWPKIRKRLGSAVACWYIKEHLDTKRPQASSELLVCDECGRETGLLDQLGQRCGHWNPHTGVICQGALMPEDQVPHLTCDTCGRSIYLMRREGQRCLGPAKGPGAYCDGTLYNLDDLTSLSKPSAAKEALVPLSLLECSHCGRKTDKCGLVGCICGQEGCHGLLIKHITPTTDPSGL